MVMQSNYPDYKRISEIENELLDIEEAYDDKEAQLVRELKKLIMGEPIEVVGKVCKVQNCRGDESDYYHGKVHPVYYPGKVHHLDGDTNNESFGNLAMVCPKCKAHILLSRFSPEDIWLLKARGLSNAEIGRLLGISRERVRQLCKKYEAKHEAELTSLSQANPDDLVKKAEEFENYLRGSGSRLRLRRRIDKRTKKKRIIAELNRLKEKEANHERTHSKEG